MTDLLLQPGQPNEYEVITDGQVVGRSSPAGTPWMWSIDFAFHEGSEWTRGFAASRDAATQASARCFRKTWAPRNTCSRPALLERRGDAPPWALPT